MWKISSQSYLKGKKEEKKTLENILEILDSSLDFIINQGWYKILNKNKHVLLSKCFW